MCFHFCFCFFSYVPVKITSSTVGLKVYAITERIKKHTSIIKKKEKSIKNSIFSKNLLNNIEVLISEALIDLYISHDEFISINNVLKEYDEIKEKIENPNQK